MPNNGLPSICAAALDATFTKQLAFWIVDALLHLQVYNNKEIENKERSVYIQKKQFNSSIQDCYTKLLNVNRKRGVALTNEKKKIKVLSHKRGREKRQSILHLKTDATLC